VEYRLYSVYIVSLGVENKQTNRLCGFPPFYHETTEKIFVQIKEGKFDFPDPYWTKVSNSGKNVWYKIL
jgi:hypothetical protein